MNFEENYKNTEKSLEVVYPVRTNEKFTCRLFTLYMYITKKKQS